MGTSTYRKMPERASNAEEKPTDSPRYIQTCRGAVVRLCLRDRCGCSIDQDN